MAKTLSIRIFKDGVKSFTTLETLTNYELGTQGNIKRIKTALEQKYIMDFLGPQPEFINLLFKLWQVKFFNQWLLINPHLPPR